MGRGDEESVVVLHMIWETCDPHADTLHSVGVLLTSCSDLGRIK